MAIGIGGQQLHSSAHRRTDADGLFLSASLGAFVRERSGVARGISPQEWNLAVGKDRQGDG